jgi:acetyl esterase
MLKAAGVETECYEYPNAAHGFTYQASADTSDACAKMTAFLKKYGSLVLSGVGCTLDQDM